MLRGEMRKIRTLPPTRVLTSWTPASVRTALHNLQLGNLDRAAYLWDAIMGDDRASAVVSTRINGLLGCSLDFEAADDSNKAQDVSEALEQRYWTMCPEPQMDSLISYGRGLGVACAELRWQRDDGQLTPTLYAWHPSHLRYDEFADTWHIMTREGEEQIEPGAGKWLLYRPYGEQFAGARTLIRALAIPWLAKTYAIQDWARHSEKLAGVIKGLMPPQPNDDERDDFIADLRNLGNSGVVGIPEGWDVELLEASAHSYEAFEKLISWANTAMAVATLGQNLATETSGGSLAAAKAQELVRQDYKQADAEGLATMLHDGVFEHWCKLNYGDAALTPWATYNTQPESDQKADADTLLTQAQAISQLKALGVGVDVNEILTRFDIPVSEDFEAAPSPQMPPPPPQMPPPNPDVDIPETPQDAPEIAPSDDDVQLPPNDDDEPSIQAVRLASGDAVSDAGGFVRGQLYVDSLGDETGKRGQAAFKPYMLRVINAIGQAEDYDDLRRSLRTVFANSDPREFAEIMEHAMILANMAGRLAVIEDA